MKGFVQMNTKIIKIKIIEKGTSNSELAKELNINPQTITNWINGRNIKNIENFIILCKKLDIKIDDLI